MKTLTKPMQSILRYGITERKKEEIDFLTNEVLDAQHDVEQLQAVVDSLTQKSQNFQAFLATADANRSTALNNKVLVDSVVQNALTLRNNSEIAFNEMVLADSKTQQLAVQTNNVINKLIYSAEVINKLANLIVRKKAVNPLISDELVSMIGTAGQDANNAVALMLVALQSVFTSQATSLESEATITLEYSEAKNLYAVLVGSGTNPDRQHCLQQLVYDAYNQAQLTYERAQLANNDTTQQLYNATADLNKAQVQLKSLQAGLAAANAAALAS